LPSVAAVADIGTGLRRCKARRDDAGRVRLGDRPVHLNPLSNEVQAFPPAERVY
jgi:hypothetical protein